MPVQPELLEHRIIVSHWSGQITYEELSASQEIGKQLIKGEPFVLIVDLAKDARLPIDIQKTRHLTEGAETLGVLIAGGSMMANLIGSLGQRLFKTKGFEYFHTLDEAIVRAREILAEHE